MVSKAYRIQTSRDRLRKQQIEIKNLQAINRLRNTPRPVSTTSFSGVSAAGNNGSTGNFLNSKGDTMIGPLALNPPVDFTVDIDSSNTIDIGESDSNSQYSSNVQIEDSPTSNTLDIIKGAAFDGQILIIRTFAPTTTITISQGDLVNGGNIQTRDGNDFVLGSLQIISLIFDEVLRIEENLGGTWRVLAVSDGSGGGGVSFPIIPPVNVLGSVGTNQNLNLSLTTAHSHTLTLIANIDITFSNFPTSTNQLEWEIEVTQDGTGEHVITWPAEVINPPTLPLSADSVTVIVFRTNDGGATVRVGNTVTTTTGSDASLWSTFPALQLVNMNINGTQNQTIAAFVDTGSTSRGSISGDLATTSLRLSTAFEGKFLISDVITDIAQFDNITGLTMLGSHVINMNNNIINTIAELQFSNSNIHTPSNENTIAFDAADNALKYSVALTTHSHRFFANTDLLASFSRIGSNEGQLSISAVVANILQADEQLFFTDSSVDPMANGAFTRNGIDVKVFSGGALRNLSDIGSGGGANTALSNLIPTSINQDLLPNIAGTFNLGSDVLRWGNCYVGRIVFPVNTSPILGDVNIVRNNNDMQCNVGTGNTFTWTFQGGLTQMELSSVELRLPNINLDMENNSITDINQVQITGTGGDVLHGFLSGTTEVFDISANESNSKVRIFAGDASGTLIEMINANAQIGIVNFKNGGISFGDTNTPTISRSGDDLQYNVSVGNQHIFSGDVIMNDDLRFPDAFDTIDFANTQTIGFTGSASSLPLLPEGYVTIKILGVERVIPYYNKT